MERPIRDYITISISLVLFATLLSLVVFLAEQSRALLAIGVEREALNKELISYREISQYDNRELTGDDVLIAVKEYTKVYDIIIELDGTNIIDLRVDDVDEKWNSDYVRKQMGKKVFDKYKSTLVKDMYGTVTGIIFKRM